jgi:hypothetical protein
MRDRRSIQRRSAVRIGMLVAIGGALLSSTTASAQVRVLVTDQASLPAPSNMVVDGGVYNAAGDFGLDSGTAVFLKRAGSSTIERLLQEGDPVPGMPHTRLDLTYVRRINPSGLLCLQADYFGGGTISNVVLTYDGSTYRKIVAGSDVAPNSGGVVFGRAMSVIGMNDAGAVAFTAPLIPLGSPSGTPVNTTLFIVPAGGTPVRIAGPGDTLPDSGGATIVDPATGDPIAGSSFSNQGEVLFRAALSTGGYGYYVGSVSGLRKIAAQGDPRPEGGTFDFHFLPTVVMNNLGQVALRTLYDYTVYLHTAASGLVPILGLTAYGITTPVPAPLDSRTLTEISLSALTDAGEVLFVGTLSGTSTNNSAAFRYTAGNPLEILAYKGQAAPGTSGQTFNSLGVQENAAGDLVVTASLSPTTPAARGVFKKPAGGSLAAVVLQGQASGVPGGGTFSSLGAARLLQDGSVYFGSDIAGGTATYGCFVIKTGGTQTLVTDLEPLPAGSRMAVRTFYPIGAGDYAGFTAHRSGSSDAWFVHNARTGVTSAVAAIGSPVPGGGTISALSSPGYVNVNASGSVVLGASVSGTRGYVFVWDVANGIRKLAGPGDIEPLSGDSIKAASLTSSYLLPLANDSGQVAISATFNTADGSGIYVVAPGQAMVKVVRANSASPYGDAAPSGGTFSSVSRWLINNQGQVAFVAQTRIDNHTSVGLQSYGIYVWSPQTGTIQAVWASAPGMDYVLSMGAFDDAGRVVFRAASADLAAGLYVGTGGTTPQPIALDGAAAPCGGNYGFSVADVRVNVLGDIMFHASLSGGTSDSGYFLRRASTGLIEAVAIQGQVAPATSSTFGTFIRTINSYPGEYFALGPTGEAAFRGLVYEGGVYRGILYRYRVGGVLERVIGAGDGLPGGGGGTLEYVSQLLGAGGPGVFYFRGVATDATYGDAIYATVSASAAADDVDGDGKSDVLWRNATQGDVWLWPMDGAARPAESYVRTVADPNWEIRGQGDFTGDGKADILWRHKITGAIYLWPMNGNSPLSETYVATVDPAYDVVGTGDFNGDGKSDILWRHLTNGEVWIWLMDGATALSRVYVGTVDPAYVIKGVGDLDGDGKADIVWHHATAGEVWVWLMDGATPLSRTWVATVSDVGYQIQGVADYDGDGKSDLLWHHATAGEVWLWRMDGATRLAETWAGTVPDTNYRIVNTGDYDGDGKADILWHHATLGEVWVWLMDGATRLSQTWVGTVADTGYRIVR